MIAVCHKLFVYLLLVMFGALACLGPHCIRAERAKRKTMASPYTQKKHTAPDMANSSTLLDAATINGSPSKLTVHE